MYLAAMQEHDLTDSKVLLSRAAAAYLIGLCDRSMSIAAENAHMSIPDTRICCGRIRHVATKIPYTRQGSLNVK